MAGKALLTFEELNTFICEIKMVINSRPLVYNSEGDLQEPLTPFRLLYGRDISKREKFKPTDGKISLDYSNRCKYLLKF